MANIDHKRFVKLWYSELLCRDIAEELGTTTQVVINYASKHRNECPVRRGKIKLDVFVALWKYDFSIKELSEYFKVSKSQIYQNFVLLCFHY